MNLKIPQLHFDQEIELNDDNLIRYRREDIQHKGKTYEITFEIKDDQTTTYQLTAANHQDIKDTPTGKEITTIIQQAWDQLLIQHPKLTKIIQIEGLKQEIKHKEEEIQGYEDNITEEREEITKLKNQISDLEFYL